jgi:hypothetical protein
MVEAQPEPFHAKACEHGLHFIAVNGGLVMADMQPSEKASRPPKTDPARPAHAEKSNSGPANPGPGGRPEDRPGSDPKNPGDFGHH